MEIELPVVGNKSYLPAMKSRDEDWIGDLRIEVPNEVGEYCRASENMNEYIRTLKVWDMIDVRGPMRK